MRLLFSEIELHGSINKSKKYTVKKIVSYFNYKVIKTNNYKLKSLTSSYTSWGSYWDLSLLGIWRTTTKEKTNIGKKKSI